MERVALGCLTATEAVLGSPADAVIPPAQSIQSSLANVEKQLELLLALHAPVAGDLRAVLTGIRLATVVRRSQELVDHVGRRVSLGRQLSLEGRDLIGQCGAVVAQMWDMAAGCWESGDPSTVDVLSKTDEDLKRIIGTVMSVVPVSAVPHAVAIQLAIVGRFYERLGKHAIEVGRQVRWQTLGVY